MEQRHYNIGELVGNSGYRITVRQGNDLDCDLCHAPIVEDLLAFRGVGPDAGFINNYIHISCAENRPISLLPSNLQPDPVNPPHYHGDYVMRIIEDFLLSFCLGQVCKYILRAGHKPNTLVLEDLKKAAWYLNREITNLEKGPVTK